MASASMFEYVVIPIPSLEEFPDNPYQLNQKVRIGGNYEHTGKTGRVVGWARSKRSHDHWTQFHPNDTAGTCQWGDQCDMLCDSEGPLVLIDPPLSEQLEWFCGQGMGTAIPIWEPGEEVTAEELFAHGWFHCNSCKRWADCEPGEHCGSCDDGVMGRW